MARTLIIAEAGVNHNGSIDTAKELIDVAADAGADYVKFQTFRAEKLVTKVAAKAAYQKGNSPSDGDAGQYEMLKKLELSEENHLTLIEHCKSRKVQFLSTAFDLSSIDFLYGLGIRLFKIPSGEMTNLQYLRKIAGLADQVILSTGMADYLEIDEAIDALAKGGTPRDLITILHCNTAYPTPMEDVNLRAMQSIAEKYKVDVGYSDHTAGIEVSIAAVSLGATVIEKHFTLDREMEGPDHRASLEPDELRAMVRSIRNIELALGDGVKRPTESEVVNKTAARKSIHLATKLSKGHALSEKDLVMMRPGDGISPMKMDQIIGKTLVMAFSMHHKIAWGDIK